MKRLFLGKGFSYVAPCSSLLHRAPLCWQVGWLCTHWNLCTFRPLTMSMWLGIWWSWSWHILRDFGRTRLARREEASVQAKGPEVQGLLSKSWNYCLYLKHWKTLILDTRYANETGNCYENTNDKMYKSGTHHTPKLNFARLEQEVGKTNECQNHIITPLTWVFTP